MKKKTVKLVSAVVVLGVVSGAYVGVNSYVSSQEKKESEAEDTSVELTSLDMDNITSVAFTAGQDKVEFDKKDDTWSEKGDADFPVNQDTLNTAVGGVASLSAAQEISDVEDLSEYDLDSPQNEITLTTGDGDTVLQIGMENDSTSQYYVRKSDDDKKVYLVDSSAVEPFMGTLYDFAESGTFPSVTSSTITEVKVDKEDGYELTQDPDNLFWNVSDGKTSEKADTDKAGTVTSAIGSLAYDSFVDYNCTDDSKYGFDDPYAVITAKYTEEETVEDDSEDTSETTNETNTDSEDESSADSDAKKDSSDTEDDSEEAETKTVEKEITICVDSDHKTAENLMTRKAFTVSMATANHVAACDYVGLVSGNKEPDKFAKAGFHATKSEFVDAPLINELPMALECEVISYDPETCRLVGRIVNVSADESVLGDNGKVDVSKLRPITFDTMNNQYLVLGEKVGQAFHYGVTLK